MNGLVSSGRVQPAYHDRTVERRFTYPGNHGRVQTRSSKKEETTAIGMNIAKVIEVNEERNRLKFNH